MTTYPTSTTTATVSGLSPVTTYQFNLVAFNANATSATPWISATTGGGVSDPDNFAGTAISTTQVGLSWVPSSGASGYSLYEMESGQPVLIETYLPSTTSATVSGLTPATTYQFNLVAFNTSAAAATPWISATTGGGVSAPDDLSGAALSSNQIGLSWAASAGANGYRLYEIENAQPILINTYSASTTSATVSGLSSVTTYQFNVVAFNDNAAAATPQISVATSGGVSVPDTLVGTAISTTQISLSWAASNGASGYRLYEMENGQSVLIDTYSSSTTSATVNGLSPVTTYQFNLVAFNTIAAAATPRISVSTAGSVSAPDNVVAAATSSSQIGLSWVAASGATGYRLYEMENGQPVLIGTYSASTTSATVSGLNPATTYQFNLVAFNANASAATPWIGATTGGGISAPDNLAGTGISNSQIGLNWTTSSAATGYRLYELEKSQPVLIGTYSASTTSATVSGLTPATTYQFNVVAFNTSSAAATPEISATTTGGVSPPSSFTGNPLSTSQINLNWTASSGATGYSLYELENGQPILINNYSSSTTSATVTGLSPATTYQFNLVAFNANAAAGTPWISASTGGGVSVPDNFAGTAVSSTQIALSWLAASGASGYRLYEMENDQSVLLNTYSSSAASATVGGLSPATTYQFNLVAFNANAAAATPWVAAASA